MSIPECEHCESHAWVRTEDERHPDNELLDLRGLAPHPIVDEDWEGLKGCLPVDLEESARETGAILRQREVRRAEDLLRLALAYALCDWPLRIVAAWAYLKGWANLSDTALMHRLQGARLWMGVLVAAWMVTSRAELAGYPVRVRLVDATTISRPGSKGTDWRVHVGLDLGRGCFDGLEVTDSKGAESLARYPATPGDILVADAGYGQGGGLARALCLGTRLVARIAIGNVRLADEAGRGLDVLEWLRGAPGAETMEREAVLLTPEGAFRVRLIVRRLGQEAAERARSKLRRRAQRQGRTASERSLEAAGLIALVTNLGGEEWGAGQVLALYRLRWQVEMAFKRLKGVLEMDRLRAKGSDLAQVYLLSKLLGALLAERMSGHAPEASLEWFASVGRPASPWRWLVLFGDAVRRAVQGSLPLEMLFGGLPGLRRYLCDAPRRRQQQYSLARRLMRILAETNPNSHQGCILNAQLLPV